MKYLVNVSYTNPAHEHVSLRRRVDTINRVIEARSQEEALNRVANQQRALGFLVRDAKVIEEAVSFGRSGGVMHYDPKAEKSEKPAKGVSAIDKDGNLVGHYPDLETAKKLKPGHTYQTSKGVAKEEVEQTDEALRIKDTSGSLGNLEKPKPSASPSAQRLAQHTRNIVAKDIKKIRKDTEPFARKQALSYYDYDVRKEEFEQTDEALLPKQQAVADKLKASELAANKEKAGYKFGKSLRMGKVAAVHKSMEREMQKESVEYIEEKLTAADPASEWIKDFVASDNPKFEGKSKKERIQMALGAYYAAKRGTNEEAGEKYNEKEVNHAEKKQKRKKGSINKLEMEPEMDMVSNPNSQGVK